MTIIQDNTSAIRESVKHLSDSSLERMFKVLKKKAERLCNGRINGHTLYMLDADTALALLAVSEEILRRPIVL